MAGGISRRAFLGAAAAAGVGGVLAQSGIARAAMRFGAPLAPVGPGVRPFPKKPVGHESLPQIEHIVVVMQENHSFDNYLGMLGRGDGLPTDKHGKPTATNPTASGELVHSFHLPSTCQLPNSVNQSWAGSHISYADGKMDGFVQAATPAAMGYWTPDDLPFYSDLAKTFVLCDRWFSSVLTKTFPNRRFLLAGTASGHVNNDFNFMPEPVNGTIMGSLNKIGVEWRDYYTDLPSVGLFPSAYADHQDWLVRVDQFFTDAAAGKLPPFCLVEPNFSQQSEEEPQDIRNGEAFSAKVINAVMQSPNWKKTVLIWCYDEAGGYYDHVPPPKAPIPDDIPPVLAPTDPPGAYDRYGFRVPAAIVSPYAKKDHVSHTLYDHTSVMKLVETKWNLPALTNRDAHANNLLDCLDFESKPAFLKPPKLAKASLDATPGACAPLDPAAVPPPEAVTPAT